jgi:hypothetical protein
MHGCQKVSASIVVDAESGRIGSEIGPNVQPSILLFDETMTHHDAAANSSPPHATGLFRFHPLTWPADRQDE